MYRVFILGAGASRGDHLDVMDDAKWRQWFHGCDISNIPPPPMIRDFFAASYLQYGVRQPSKELQVYIRDYWDIPVSDSFGHGMWKEVNLEDVFTSATIKEEFYARGTDDQARTLLLINEIKQHIGSVLAASTAGRRGRYSKMLIDKLGPSDTVINFNYDLLVDAEFSLRNDRFQYSNFSEILLNVPLLRGKSQGDGLYLKMHGSLNWYACTNQYCPKFQQLRIYPNLEEYTIGMPSTDYCLQSYLKPGIRSFTTCEGCQNIAGPVLIPPLLNKQILTTPVFRSVWGNGLAKLKSPIPDAVVVIGYSFPKTDFYSDWLFHNIRFDEGTKIVIVNPANDPDHSDHQDFRERMRRIFHHGYYDQFTKFDQLEDILDFL